MWGTAGLIGAGGGVFCARTVCLVPTAEPGLRDHKRLSLNGVCRRRGVRGTLIENGTLFDGQLKQGILMVRRD